MIWDDHIPDPDNPSQMRQIDITIRRDEKLTLVECRDRQSRQDVQWIEELIGRRASLRADAVIAVSSSGFTAGALKKAREFGIIPRDLRELTQTEVEDWGRPIALTLYFYQYSDLELSVCFKSESVSKVDVDVVRSEIASYPGMQSLFNAAARQLGTLDPMNVGSPVNFGLRLQLPGLQLSGEPVLEIDFRGKAVLTSREVLSPAVFAYAECGQNSAVPATTVETFALGETSIVHDAGKISLFLDVSQLQIPPFCQFRFFRLSGRDEMQHEAVELVGLDRLWIQQGKMNVAICSKC